MKTDEEFESDSSDDEFDVKMKGGWNSNIEAEKLISQIDEEDRSTHFIAIKVTNPDIIQKAVAIQAHIIQKEEVKIHYRTGK